MLNPSTMSEKVLSASNLLLTEAVENDAAVVVESLTDGILVGA